MAMKTNTKKEVVAGTRVALYADIMSDEGLGLGGTTVQVQVASGHGGAKTACAFFADKRAGSKNRLVTLEGMGNTMCFDTTSRTGRGIRPWEKARYEAKERRYREVQRQQAARSRVPSVAGTRPAAAMPMPSMPMPSSASMSSMNTAACSTASLAASVASTVLDGWDD